MKYLDINEISKELDTAVKALDVIRESMPSPENMDIGELLERSKVNFTEVIPEPPICLQIKNGSEYSIIGTLGNFSAVIGKAKSKKTFLITIALATAIRNDLILEKFKGNLPASQRTVLLFDTEQSRYHVQKVVKRVCQLAGVSQPDNFHCYGLRSYTTKKRIEMIDHALNTIPGIGLVVIDGIRDLVHDINNPEEATQIVTKLMQWSEEKNIHIITVLHQNKGDNNARGHLGSEVINKAETVISVTKETKDPMISIVEPEYCRDKDFPPFAFKIDEKGLPCVLHDWQPPKESKKAQISPFDLPRDTHLKALVSAFRQNPSPRYKEFLEQIRYAFQLQSITFGVNKAKEFFTYYENQRMIEKVKEVGTQYPTYKLIAK